MRLRDLELKDAPFMLEWMHDKNVVENLRGKFAEKTLEDCNAFIKTAENKENDIHLAIVSDEDEYMGTVSLKSIDRDDNSAEFAITVRKSAMGRGYSWYGMKEIIRIGFDELGLEKIYWCVSKDNKRAVRFYDKHNFNEALNIPAAVIERYAKVDNLKWYSVLKVNFAEVS